MRSTKIMFTYGPHQMINTFLYVVSRVRLSAKSSPSKVSVTNVEMLIELMLQLVVSRGTLSEARK